MMHVPRILSFGRPVAFLVLFAALAFDGACTAQDPLAAEIARWSEIVQSKPDNDPVWGEMKQSSQAVLARAGQDLRAGRRLLALRRFTAARADLGAAAYLSERPAEQRKDMAAFDAEWKRMGGVMQESLGAPSPAAFEGKPAAVRALGEAALLQIREYYMASLDYGHNTVPNAGLYYLGNAQGQRDLVAFYRTLPASSDRPAPRLRSVLPEIDALQTEVLAAYRPPLSIDKHGDFITASSLLKEARELDAAGLHHGALLRYLQAAERFALLRAASPSPAADALAARLGELRTRLAAGNVDHSLGQLFLESAEANAAETPPAAAVAIAQDVLPRYFAALELPPARPAPAPAPQATVTLVRWPYT